MDVFSLITNQPLIIAIDAIYYLVRELKQLLCPPGSRKEHLEDVENSKPSAESILLIQEIKSKIELAESKKIENLSEKTLIIYIAMLFDAFNIMSEKQLNVDRKRGAMLLKKMRLK